MSITEFCARHGSGERGSVESLATAREREREVDELLHAQIGTGVVLRDVVVGDGLMGQISPELRDAFAGLMGEKADTYDKVRRILRRKLDSGDPSVLGLVNKIKGQVGEHRFLAAARTGASARLATLGNQEGWDVALDHAWGTQHVQVKMYSSADEVIRHMKSVDAKLARGTPIFDGDKLVRRIDFAVPENIATEVSRKAEALGLNSDVIPIKTTAKEAADVVWEGVNNVGPKAMRNAVKQLLGIAATAAVLHGVASAFMVYKGAKEKREAVGDVAENTAVTVAGAAAGASMEFILRRVLLRMGPAGLLVAGTSLSTRAILQRVLERTDFVGFLREHNEAMEDLAYMLLVSSS